MHLIEYGLDTTMVSGQTSRMIPARVLEANREIFTLVCEHGEINAQVVAVNFDYVFIMVALNHDFNMNRIQRYFSIALQSGALPVIVLTKADINERYESIVDEVSSFTGCKQVYAISALTGLGLSALEKYSEYCL